MGAARPCVHPHGHLTRVAQTPEKSKGVSLSVSNPPNVRPRAQLRRDTCETAPSDPKHTSPTNLGREARKVAAVQQPFLHKAVVCTVLGRGEQVDRQEKFANLLVRPDQWKNIMRSAARVKAPESSSPGFDHLTENDHFGPNPGALRMFTYLPPGLADRSALLVVLHGCTQRAAGYD